MAVTQGVEVRPPAGWAPLESCQSCRWMEANGILPCDGRRKVKAPCEHCGCIVCNKCRPSHKCSSAPPELIVGSGPFARNTGVHREPFLQAPTQSPEHRPALQRRRPNLAVLAWIPEQVDQTPVHIPTAECQSCTSGEERMIGLGCMWVDARVVRK